MISLSYYYTIWLYKRCALINAFYEILLVRAVNDSAVIIFRYSFCGSHIETFNNRYIFFKDEIQDSDKKNN